MSNHIEASEGQKASEGLLPKDRKGAKVIPLKVAQTESAAKPSVSNFDALPDNAFMRLPQVTELVSVSKPTIWRWCKEGKFPSPRKLSDQVTAWNVGEVRAWLGSHCAA